MKRTHAIGIIAVLVIALIPSEAMAAEARIKNLRQRHVRCGDRTCLKVTADLVPGPDLVGPDDCYEGRPFKLQRRRHGRWVTVKEGVTQADLDMIVKTVDRPGLYRILVPASRSESTDIDCYKVVKEFRHSH